MFQHNALNQYNAAIRQHMHACSQLQLTNPTMTGALPVPPLIPAPSAPPIILLRLVPQFGIHPIPQSHPVPPIVPSIIPVYVPPQHSAHHPSVVSQFVPPHSQAHYNHTSAPANPNET